MGIVSDVDNFFTDADGDALTYTASYEHPGVMSVSVSGTTFSTYFRNPGTTKLTYGAHDGYGGYVERTATITSTANETRSVRENAAAGTAVGRPVAGTPYDDGDDQTNDALTHTLHGEAAGSFVIDSATGQISVKQGASLDYETKASYTGQVKWTVQGQVCVANLTITITDAEPGKPATPTVTRTTSNEPMNPADGRVLDGPGRERQCPHLVRGAVPQKGRPRRDPRGVDALRRAGAAEEGQKLAPVQP